MTCPIQGTAVVRLVGGEVEWVSTDPEIHVSAELAADADARRRIQERYELGERCPWTGDFHARLADDIEAAP